MNVQFTVMESKLDDIILHLAAMEEANTSTMRLVRDLQERVEESDGAAQVRKKFTFNRSWLMASTGHNQHGSDHDYAKHEDVDREVSFKAKTKEGQDVTVFVNRNELISASNGIGIEGNTMPVGSQSNWSTLATEDIQAEFRVVQDAYSRIKLQSDMKFSGGKGGVKAAQKETAMVISNCTRYAETALKILTYIQDQAGNPVYEVNPQLQEMFVCMYALVQYLQEDHCSLIIAGSYGPRTQMIFRNLRKNASAFTPDLIEDIKSAAQLASIPQEVQPMNTRGRGYSGWSGGPGGRFRGGFNQYRGRGRVFNNKIPAVTYPRQVPTDRQVNQEM